ncbi:hypothetical protein [Kytococcus sp. Marseille-QA3725]
MATTAAMERLTRALVDDAAIFPPGLSPVTEAVAQHRRWRTAPLGSRLGPLLLSVDAIASLPEVLQGAESATDPLPVGVAARPGTTTEQIRAAVGVLDSLGDTVTLRVVERAADADWEESTEHGVDLAVELPRDLEEATGTLERLAALGAADGPRAVAKWRTQASPAGPVPTPAELAGFLVRCVGTGTPFKLTGGLHHAVARTAPAQSGEGTEEMHGMLNVVLATHRAVTGAGEQAVREELSEREPQRVADRVRGLDPDAAQELRRWLVSFGCCGVTDPLGEAAELGLIDPADLRTTP